MFLIDGNESLEKKALRKDTDKKLSLGQQVLTPSKQLGSLTLKASPPGNLTTPKRLNTLVDESAGSHPPENDPNLHSVNSFMSPTSSTLFLQPGSGQNSSDAFLTGFSSSSSQPAVPFGSAFKMDEAGPSKQDLRSGFFFSSAAHAVDAGSPAGSKTHSPHHLMEHDASPLFGKTGKESQDSFSMEPYVFGLAEHEGMSDLYGQDFQDQK